MFFVRAENLQVAEWPAAGDFARMSLILIFAFAGIEVGADPQRRSARPRAHRAESHRAGDGRASPSLYIALQVVAQGILGAALSQSAVPLADAAGASLGGVGAIAAAGRRRDLDVRPSRRHDAVDPAHRLRAGARWLPAPRARAIVHPIYRSPQLAIITQSLLTLALAITGTFEQLAIIANVSALALYLGCAIAAWKLGQSPIVPVLACGVIVWLLTGLTIDEWLAFGALHRRRVASVYVASSATRRTSSSDRHR